MENLTLFWALCAVVLFGIAVFRVLELSNQKLKPGRQNELFCLTDWFSTNLIEKRIGDTVFVAMIFIGGLFASGLYMQSTVSPDFVALTAFFAVGVLGAGVLFRILFILGQAIADGFFFLCLLLSLLMIIRDKIILEDWKEDFE